MGESMASDRRLRKWISDRLLTFLGCPKSVGVQDVLTLASESSSTDDLVEKLVELGFTYSLETFTFASDIYGKLPHDVICTSNDQMNERVVFDLLDHKTKLSSNKDNNGVGDSLFLRQQSTKTQLSKTQECIMRKQECDSLDDDDVRTLMEKIAKDSGRNVDVTSEQEDVDDDNNSDGLEDDVYLWQWISDKLLTLLSHPKNIGVQDIVCLAERCSSADDLVCELIKFGFNSSSETCNFAAQIYTKITRRDSIIREEQQMPNLKFVMVENSGANTSKLNERELHKEKQEELTGEPGAMNENILKLSDESLNYAHAFDESEKELRYEIYGVVKEPDGASDVDEEEQVVPHLNSDTIENNDANTLKYKIPESYDKGENTNEENTLSEAMQQYQYPETKGNVSPSAEPEHWVEHLRGKPGVQYRCKDKNSDDYQYAFATVDFVKSPVVVEPKAENVLDEEEDMLKRENQHDSKTLSFHKFRDDFLKVVQDHQVVIIVDETGSGKTTQIPRYLHEGGYTIKGKVVCIQPHQVAALSAAANMSQEMGVNLQHEVGYSLWFDDFTSEDTIIKYTTGGVLLRELIGDPGLSSYSVVMVAEATERTLPTDILLGLMQYIIHSRPDMKLLISSSSLAAEKLSDYFDSAPIFKMGEQCPVEIYNTRAPVPDYMEAAVDTVVQIHLSEGPGDILVFLPGEEEAQEVNDVLEQRVKGMERTLHKLKIYPLYASLSIDLLAEILESSSSARKVILVTDVGKVLPSSSGIKYVVDPGFCKIRSYNPSLGIESLLIIPISKASANERAAMCGSTVPRKCFRLYTRDTYIHGLEDLTAPEIQRANLAAVILTLKACGINDLVNFPYLDPPPSEAMIKALSHMFSLGALNSRGELTISGKRMTVFPLDPMLSKMIVASDNYSCSDEAISIASMLSVGKSFFFRPKDEQDKADLARLNFHAGDVGDHIALLNVYNSWKESGYSTKWCHENYVQAGSMRRAKQIRDQLEVLLARAGIDVCSNANDLVAIKKAITSGFFHHAARLHSDGIYRTIKNPQIVHLDPNSGLSEVRPQWVIFHEMVYNTVDHIGQVTEVKPEWLLEIAPHIYKKKDMADYGSKQPEDGLRLPT